MSKVKNALNIYEIAVLDKAFDATDGYDDYTGTFLRLARGITDVSDATDESVDDVAYFDGDGTAESEVTSVKMGYDFEGQYIHSDKAMKYIRSIETKTGDDRKVIFRVTKVQKVGDEIVPILVYTGRGTVAGIVTSGGSASDYETFSCTVSFDRQPHIKNIETEDDGEGEGEDLEI